MGNEIAYRRRRTVRRYADEAAKGLTDPEIHSLKLVPLSYDAVLDIGIGGGRTTGPLAQRFNRYVGIDYSPAMIAAARSFHPQMDLRVMDARKLDFGEKQFDCVMFSFNGIDCVSYEDRQLILREIIRVMRPNGYFIYSTKNIQYWKMPQWKDQFWHPAIFQSWKAPFRSIPNRLRNFWKQSLDEARGIAFVNEQALGFSLVHAYVDITKEIAALRARGLTTVNVIGSDKSTPGYDSDDEWVYITAVKKA
jgi:SAM-dependent methyltransferase